MFISDTFKYTTAKCTSHCLSWMLFNKKLTSRTNVLRKECKEKTILPVEV